MLPNSAQGISYNLRNAPSTAALTNTGRLRILKTIWRALKRNLIDRGTAVGPPKCIASLPNRPTGVAPIQFTVSGTPSDLLMTHPARRTVHFRAAAGQQQAPAAQQETPQRVLDERCLRRTAASHWRVQTPDTAAPVTEFQLAPPDPTTAGELQFRAIMGRRTDGLGRTQGRTKGRGIQDEAQAWMADSWRDFRVGIDERLT